jgi:hypothetical protein
MKPRICDACETVSHCSRHGCIPVQIERRSARLRALAPWLAAAALILAWWLQ